MFHQVCKKLERSISRYKRLFPGRYKQLVGYLRNQNFQVSSFLGAIFHAKEARLNNRFKNEKEPGAWKGKTGYNQWIQVDLGKVTTVTGIATQGATDGMKVNQWVSLYSVQFSNNGKVFHKYYDQNFPNGVRVVKFKGNTDRNTIVKNNFPYPIHARYIRVITRFWNRGMVMRFELYGCPSGIVLYSFLDDCLLKNRETHSSRVQTLKTVQQIDNVAFQP